jgi:cellulose synthase/poly-beta-1,6-N-acetylglucosamine synthase-like glycosyltransferase
MRLKWHIAVLIPASNEEDLVQRCLSSVKAACNSIAGRASIDIVLAVDNSTDRTKSIGGAMLAGCGIVIETDRGVVGEARAQAASVALERHQGPSDCCWLVNTDADSFVPAAWLQHHLELADQGVHAVAGTVGVDSFEEHAAYVEERFRKSYLISPNGSHRHVHGTNLGIRADWYQRAGGWRSLATGEDHDLWDRLGEIGAKRVSVSHLEVMTSGRRIGRAPDGFAAALSAHNLLPV